MMDLDLDLAMKFEEQYIQIAIVHTICSSRLPAQYDTGITNTGMHW
jgi:hypothetical protein